MTELELKVLEMLKMKKFRSIEDLKIFLKRRYEIGANPLPILRYKLRGICEVRFCWWYIWHNKKGKENFLKTLKPPSVVIIETITDAGISGGGREISIEIEFIEKK